MNNDKNHPFDNKVISGEYPPGSPFKIITGTAALDLKKVSPEEMILIVVNIGLSINEMQKVKH